MSVLGYALACALPAFCVSLLVTAAMRRIAPKLGLIDQPAARKVHAVPTPLGGGIGIVCGFVLPLLAADLTIRWCVAQSTLPVWLPVDWHVHLPGVLQRTGQLWAIVATGLVLSVMGLIDDL